MRALAVALVVLAAAGASAQESESREKKLEDRVRELEERLRRLEGLAPPSAVVPAEENPTTPNPKPPGAGEQAPAPPVKPPEDRITDLENTLKDAVHAIVDNVHLTVMLDAAYVWNFNAPRNIRRDTQAFRLNDVDYNSFEITWAKLGAGRAVNNKNEWDAGFELEFGAGREAQNVLSLTPGFLFQQPFNFAQAYVDLQLPTPYNPVLVRVGRQYGFMGTESLDTPVNPNFSLSYITNFTPFTVTGVSVGMDLGAGFRYAQFVVNGWDIIIDNNHAKTVGGQLQWSNKDPEISITANWIYGPEKDNNNSDERWLTELDAYFTPIEVTQFRASLQFGEEDHADVKTGNVAKFGAAQLVFRQEFYEIREHLRRFAFAVRGTYYRDQGGARTGIDQALFEETGTFEVHFTEHAKLRFEYRRDMSTRDHVFLGRRRTPARDAEDTVSMDAAFAF